MIARIELQQVFLQTREAAGNTTGPGEEASLYRSDLPQKARNIRLQFALLQKQAGSVEHLDTQHSGIDLQIDDHAVERRNTGKNLHAKAQLIGASCDQSSGQDEYERVTGYRE